jgi:hypothetical protein
MDPLDARIIEHLAVASAPYGPSQDAPGLVAELFRVTYDEAYFSFEHLHELGCLQHSPNSTPAPRTTAKARLLKRALGD